METFFPIDTGIQDYTAALGIPIDWNAVDAIGQFLFSSATNAPDAYGFINGLDALLNSVGVPFI